MNDFSLRTSPTFLDGVFMTASGIADAVLLYCGAACVHEHAMSTLRRHDPRGSLATPADNPRLITTFTDQSVAPMGTLPVIEKTARKIVERCRPGLLILAELSRITIAGEDLPGLADELRASIEVPVVAASFGHVERDSGDAATQVLADLASHLDVAGRADEAVAIIGYPWTRTGGEHEGDLRELARLCEGAGRAYAGSWLSGQTTAELARVAGASTLVATGAGRKAASIIASRTGATVHELPLPIGLGQTAEWVRQLAAGESEQAEKFVGAELAEATERMERVVTGRLAGRRAAIIASDDWLAGLARMFEEDFGIEVPVRLGRSRHGPDGADPDALDRDFDPSVRLLNERLGAELAGGGLDFIVGSSWERRALQGEVARVPFVELGYPSFRAHYLRPAPHLGFRGTVTWAERINGALPEI